VSSFWLDEPSEPLPARRFDGRAEVAVIGGGVTGCSCALTLAERGVRVRLHEAREVAGGASGRNGGFALRGATLPYDEARTQLGPERARLVMALTERSLDRMESLAGDAFRRVGAPVIHVHYIVEPGAKGLKLNYPEAVAVISAVALDGARAGKTIEDVTKEARTALTKADVMDGVADLVPMVQIEAVFTDGSRLVTVHTPIQ